MCTNQECLRDELSIEELGLSVTGLLEHYELSRFEHRFGEDIEISLETQNQLIEEIFPLRKLCWYCARPTIENAMKWNFTLLESGVALHLHGELIGALNEIGGLPSEWNELLMYFYVEPADPWTKRPIKWAHIDELVTLIVEANSAGLTPDGLGEIQSWHNTIYEDSITSEELKMIVSCGFRDAEDLELLRDSENELDEFFYGRFPSRQVLEQLPNGLSDYVALLQILEGGLFEVYDSYETEEGDVLKMSLLGIEAEVLAELSNGILEDIDIVALFPDLTDELVDCRGNSFTNQFCSSVCALKTVNLELNQENVIRFWGLTPELILHLVDNGHQDEEKYRLARFVTEPVESDAWTDVLDSFPELSEICEWVKVGLSASESRDWKLCGFDSESADKWRNKTDNPEIARRRLEAGISP